MKFLSYASVGFLLLVGLNSSCKTYRADSKLKLIYAGPSSDPNHYLDGKAREASELESDVLCEFNEVLEGVTKINVVMWGAGYGNLSLPPVGREVMIVTGEASEKSIVAFFHRSNARHVNALKWSIGRSMEFPDKYYIIYDHNTNIPLQQLLDRLWEETGSHQFGKLDILVVYHPGKDCFIIIRSFVAALSSEKMEDRGQPESAD